MPATLGIDVGTQGVKGVLLDPDRSPQIVARAARHLALISGLPPGAAEQHPDEWWDAIVAVIRELLATEGAVPADVRAIGISGQQHGSVFVDNSGRPVRPAKLWCDTSTASEARALSEKLGRPIPVGFTASKVAWFATHEPSGWAATTGVLLPHDFANMKLTGRRVTEAGDASGTGYFDPRSRTWDPAAVAATAPGLAERLPELLPDGSAAGALTADAAATLGLSTDVVVSAGGGDNMMSAIGSGATRAGVVVVSLGTSGTVFARTDHCVIDPEGLIAPFCSSDGAWLPLLCVMNCTGVTEEVRAAFLPNSDDALERLTTAAEAVAPGCDGVTFVPFLTGERVPNLPGATGTLEGLRAGSLRPGVVFRAALEGITSNLALGVERLRGLGVTVDEVRLVGGGSKNRLWRTLIADFLHARVTLPVEPESAALGAAIQALWTLRRVEEPGLDCHAVAAPLVELEPEAIAPDPSRGDALRPVLERYRSRISGLGE